MGVNYSLMKENLGFLDIDILKDLKKIKLRDIKVKLIKQDVCQEIY